MKKPIVAALLMLSASCTGPGVKVSGSQVEMVLQSGHTSGKANFPLFLPDGKRLITCDDNDIVVWDIGSGLQTQVLRAAGCEPRLSGDRKYLFTFPFELGRGSSIAVWDATTLRQVHEATRPPNRGVWPVGMSPDGKAFFNSDQEGLSLVDLKGNVAWHHPSNSGYTMATPQRSGDGEQFFMADGGDLKLARTSDGEIERTIPLEGVKLGDKCDFSFSVPDCAIFFRFVLNDTAILSRTKDGLQVHDLATGKLLRKIKLEQRQRDEQILDDGARVGIATKTRVAVVDLRTGAVTGEMPISNAGAFDYSPDGSRVAMVIRGTPDIIEVRDVASGAVLTHIQAGLPPVRMVTTVTTSTSKEPFVTLFWSIQGGAIHLWDLYAARIIQTFRLPANSPRKNGVQASGLNWTDDYVICTDGIWDRRSGRPIAEPKRLDYDIVEFSPDYSKVAFFGHKRSFHDYWGLEVFELRTEKWLLDVPDAHNFAWDKAGNAVVTAPDFHTNPNGVTYFDNGHDWESGARDKRPHSTSPLDEAGRKRFERYAGSGKIVNISGDWPNSLIGLTDGRMVLVDRDGTPILTFVVTGGDDFIAYTPEGYYRASPGGAKAVAFVVDGKPVPFDQLDTRLNRPDLVLARLDPGQRFPKQQRQIAAIHHAVEKRLAKLGLPPDPGTDLALPEVELGALPALVKDRKLTLKISASDRKAGIDRLLIWVDDVPALGEHGVAVGGLPGAQEAREVPIELRRGINRIQVSALSKSGIESLRAQALVTLDAPAGEGPELRVLAVGVSHFKDSAQDLNYAAKDAQDLSATLSRLSASAATTIGTRFAKVEVKLLTEADATKESIAAAHEFLAQGSVEDTAVVFVAGHGLRDEKDDYYYATTDIDFENPAQRGLPYDQIETLLDSVPARNRLLLLDTCNSGEADEETKPPALLADNKAKVTARGFKSSATAKATTPGAVCEAQPADGAATARGFKSSGKPASCEAQHLEDGVESLRELFADVRRTSGAMVIASASGREYAYETDALQNGVFTHALIDGLGSGKADLDKDGTLRISELRDYVVREVIELTNGGQHPTLRRENLANDFAVR